MRYFFLFFFVIILAGACAQTPSVYSRVEFNGGSRTYREQIILTPDSVIAVREDFRKSDNANIERRAARTAEWKAVTGALKNIKPDEIPALKSPSEKRAWDGASFGTLIITTADGRSFTHEFDDDNTNKRLQPLMKEIRRIAK